MPANANDLLLQVGDPGTATTLSAPGYTAGGTSITVGSTSNWPTATGVIFAIDEAEVVDGEEVRIDGTYNEFEGVVSTGTSITSVDWVRGVGDRNYAAGALTRVYIPVSAERENRIVTWGTAEHSQTGTHTNITATSITATTGTFTSISVAGTGTGGGWDGVPTGTITAVTANGNRNYDLTTSADNTALISPGMRLRTTRTVAAPTQCATFDGTNDYFSKTTPAGMTFTDDWACGAWLTGLSAYGNTTIESRFNGTSGWQFAINSSGQVTMIGYNASAANYRQITSYQSVPPNKKVHVAAQMDMSAYTLTSTTCFIMIDGVEVPAFLSQGGTNPTALVQAGDYQIGALNGANFFNGKLAQVWVSSAKITQANIRTLISQGITSALATTHSIISAYSLSNSLTDINATNANNLTANGGVLATTADSPFGGQAGGTISSTLDYGIVAKVTASTITVNVAEGCTIPTSGGVSAVSYSTYKSPYGFPGQRGKWVVKSLYLASATQAGTTVLANYAGRRISFPVGQWKVEYNGRFYYDRAGTLDNSLTITLSTTTTTLTIPESTTGDSMTGSGVGANLFRHFPASKMIDYDAQTDTILYLLYRMGTANSLGDVSADAGALVLTAENAYL